MDEKKFDKNMMELITQGTDKEKFDALFWQNQLILDMLREDRKERDEIKKFMKTLS